MKMLQKLALTCLAVCPMAAFAGGSATGTITHIFIDASYVNGVYVTLSGVKTGNPACSTSTRGQFVVPISPTLANTNLDYQYMVNLLESAMQAGVTLTITGQNVCNLDNNVETIQNVQAN
jgi:hypothetical protein